MGRREPARLRRVPARVVALEPLFVLDLARPELLEQAAELGRRHRNFTSLHLEPALRSRRWASCSTGSSRAPGASSASRSLRARKASRSTRSRRSACCSTAASSFRRLRLSADRRDRRRSRYPRRCRASSPLASTASPEERRLLQDGAVLGKTFTRQALAAVGGPHGSGARTAADVARPQGDPRRPGRPTSPEHGQYGFLQDLVRHVAYETLSKRSAGRGTSKRPPTCRRLRKRRRDRRGDRCALP